MEKKLKINFILKGIAVFAFVAFCLLAILAGVTLPFVSNASTADCAFASAESDCATASAGSDTFNPLDFCISLSECNTTDTYYGFYISDSLWNYARNYDYSQTSGLLPLFYLNFIDSTSTLYFVAGKTDNVAYLALTDMNNMVKYFEDNFNYSYFTPYVVYPQGFKLSNILDGVPSGTDWATSFKVFTSVPYRVEKETLISYGFNSEFGFIGTLRSNRIYFNLKVAPKIPSDMLCPYGENAIINGYYKQGNDFYLPVLEAYDSFGNVVSAGFTGWKFTCVLNTDGSPTTSFRLDFLVENLAVYHIDSVELNGKCFTTPDYSHGYAIVGADYVNLGISVYSSPTSQYFYDLKPNYFRQSQVRDFLAFFHYLTYEPVDNAYYLAGYNAAGDTNYNNGYNVGYSAGEKSGYNTGFSAGDSQGYARGVENAGNYSFLSLFGAIFDAPIKAIFGGTSTLPAGTTITDSNGNTITLQSTTTVNRAGLLNFNIMGVNLSGFVLALFSLSILVVVIKFALGRGR